MAEEACSVSGCDRKHHARGLCGTHYQRWRTRGSEDGGREVGDGRNLHWLKGNCDPDHDACVIWPFGVGSRGYGQISVGGCNHSAHRLVCVWFHGACPDDMEAAHSCGNRACVNQKHLRWATKKQNAADRVIHGTNPQGEKHGMAKLTHSDVVKILRDQRKQREIAADFGVDQKTVWNIKNRRTYREALGM